MLDPADLWPYSKDKTRSDLDLKGLSLHFLTLSPRSPNPVGPLEILLLQSVGCQEARTGTADISIEDR